MSLWSTVARAYSTSFATLCDGTHEDMLDAALGAVETSHGAKRATGPTLLDVGCGDGRLAAASSAGEPV